MVCVSFPIVMTNGSTERHHELLQRIRKEHPMITQLNLRKQLNIINLVLSHDRMEEVQIIRNKILAECGEPLPISQEDMQKVFAYQDLAKLKLADVLRPCDGEALVFDEMVSATNTRLAVVGVRASNDDRRGEIISNVMMLLGLKHVEHTSIAYTKGTVVDVAATTRDSLATLSSSEPPPSPIAPAVSTTSRAPRNNDNDEDEDDLDDLMRDIDQQLVAANPDQAPIQSPTVPRDEHEQILADIQVACASGYPAADTQASSDPTDAMKAANSIIADLTKLVPPSVRFAVRGPQTIRVTLRSSPRQTGGKKVNEAAITTSNATLLADVKSSVYRRCGCVMELIFTQPWLVKIVAKRSTTFCSHIKRCTRTTDQEHLQVVQAPPLMMMDDQVSQMKVALYGAVSAERHAFLAEQFQQCVDNTITVDDLMLTPQVVKALADECNVAVLASFMYDDLVQSASILGLTADIERFRQQADLHFDNFT